MYFSGQMLDEYSRHLALLKPTQISEIVSDDADPADKARVGVAGIVTSVTQKTTRNGDAMAFFTLEDRVAEIECLTFSRQYGELSHLIHTDAAAFVSGSISLREDEPPKLIVNRIEPLVENSRFRPEAVRPMQERTATPSEQPRVSKTEPAAPEQPKPSAAPRRLFLRVPDAKGSLFLKARNLVELFEGGFPAFFYFADEKRYEVEPIGVALSDYVLGELRRLLGDENVILK